VLLGSAGGEVDDDVNRAPCQAGLPVASLTQCAGGCRKLLAATTSN